MAACVESVFGGLWDCGFRGGVRRLAFCLSVSFKRHTAALILFQQSSDVHPHSHTIYTTELNIKTHPQLESSGCVFVYASSFTDSSGMIWFNTIATKQAIVIPDPPNNNLTTSGKAFIASGT